MVALVGVVVVAALIFFGVVRRVWVRLKVFLCCDIVEEIVETEFIDDVDGDNNIKVDNIIFCCGGRTVNVRNEYLYDREWVREVLN